MSVVELSPITLLRFVEVARVLLASCKCSSDCHALQPAVALSFAATRIPPIILSSAVNALHGDSSDKYETLSIGFGMRHVGAYQIDSGDQVCSVCSELLGLRSMCIHCGSPRDVSSQVAVLASRTTFAMTTLQSVEYVKQLAMRRVTTSGDESVLQLLERERHRAIDAGIDRLHECALRKGVFADYGGDILFLLRNILQTAGLFISGEEVPQQIASLLQDNQARRDQTSVQTRLVRCAAMLHEVMVKWMSSVTLSEVEMGGILNAVEALHVLEQLNVVHEASLPSLETTLRVVTNKNCHPMDNPLRSTHSHRETEPSSGHSQHGTSSDVEQHAQSAYSNERARRYRRASTPQCLRGNKFNTRMLKQQLAQALSEYDITDVMGCNPKSGRVPMTDASHCCNCGTEHSRRHIKLGSTLKPTQCVGCNAHLRSQIDFGSLTDALVWSYLFEEIGVPLSCSNAHVSFCDVIAMLPAMRRYYRLDELGNDFYRLQCYFLTHFIYIVSDWGRHTIRRELFEEEYIFLVKNMSTVIDHKDPELVGEFLQCLRIFNVSKQHDPDVWNLVERAMLFLLEVELRLGSSGIWKKSSKVYDRYHSSYCGAIGLMVYDFHGNPLGPQAMTADVVIPRAFRCANHT
mmetsp:Transcript_10235/g.41430  ORF Transcript_10235/g.41430 Transcript_10235/m.41430 type:complete len:632 (-) Transcript_10235:1023-2918(-)